MLCGVSFVSRVLRSASSSKERNVKSKLSLPLAALTIALAVSPVGAVVIAFDAGTPSHLLNGGSLVSNAGLLPLGVSATYVSGGNGLTGIGTTWPTAHTSAVAGSAIDHVWLQGDPAITYAFGAAQSQVAAIAGIDHGPLPEEALEFIVWGSLDGVSLTEEGAISAVYDPGYDPAVTAAGVSDDFSSIWKFSGSYTHFIVTSGDHIAGFTSPGEFEIDGLATVIPEPGTLGLLGLGLLGFARRRRKPQR